MCYVYSFHKIRVHRQTIQNNRINRKLLLQSRISARKNSASSFSILHIFPRIPLRLQLKITFCFYLIFLFFPFVVFSFRFFFSLFPSSQVAVKLMNNGLRNENKIKQKIHNKERDWLHTQTQTHIHRTLNRRIFVFFFFVVIVVYTKTTGGIRLLSIMHLCQKNEKTKKHKKVTKKVCNLLSHIVAKATVRKC